MEFPLDLDETLNCLSWELKTEKPFIQTMLGFAIVVVLVVAILAPYLGLIDRAPRPTSQEEAETTPGFTLDSDQPPGYTIGDKDSLEIEATWPWWVLIGLVVACSTFVAAGRYSLLGAGFLAFVVYLGFTFIVINCAPGFHYLPESTEILNRLSMGFLITFIVQGIAVGVVAGMYSRPLVPSVPEQQKHEYYQLNIRNTWRYTQAILSITIAGAAGILIPTVLNASNFGRGGITLPLLGITAFIGAVLGFGILRIWAISRRITEDSLFSK